MTYVVDTHALVWFFEDDPRLSSHALSTLLDTTARIIVPTIVLAEITYLCARQRIRVDRKEVLERVLVLGNVAIHPLDESVVDRLPTNLDVHDAIIVATGFVYRDVLHEPTAVLTKDKEIRNSGLIDTVW